VEEEEEEEGKGVRVGKIGEEKNTGIHNSRHSQSGRDALSTPNKPSTIMKCHLKKILVCSSCLQTLDMTTANLQGAPYFSFCFFVLKICTDTYKIIDKNIPLLTIRLGGKPCERLGGAGWLAGGFGGEGS